MTNAVDKALQDLSESISDLVVVMSQVRADLPEHTYLLSSLDASINNLRLKFVALSKLLPEGGRK